MTGSGFPCSFAVLRAVPHPYVGEGVAVGVVLQSRPAEFIGARLITDPAVLRDRVPDVDIELLARYLASCEAIVAGEESAGEIALLSAPERFHWLTAPRSDVLQPGPVERSAFADPAAAVEALFEDRVLGGTG